MKRIFFLPIVFTLAYAAQAESLDISLSNGVRIVAQDSRLIKIASCESEATFAQALQARAAFLPQVVAYVKNTYMKYEPASKFGASRVSTSQRQFLSAGADIYQTIFDFGKSLYAYKAASNAVDAAKINLDIVKRLAVLEFIMAYFDSLEAHRMVDVAQKNVEALEAYHKDVSAMFDQGVVVKSDLLGVNVKLADAKERLISARNDVVAADLRINLLLAMPMTTELKLEDIQAVEGGVVEQEEAQKTALQRRLEVAFIDHRLAALKYKTDADRAENYPVVFAQGGSEYTENKYQVYQSNNYAVVGAKVALFDGGYTPAKAQEDKALAQKLRIERAKLRDDICFEVKVSRLNLNAATEKSVVAGDALDSAKENTRMVRARYAEGAATSTEVLEAIALETGAQMNSCDADYELKRALARLVYSTGGDIIKIYGGRDENK